MAVSDIWTLIEKIEKNPTISNSIVPTVNDYFEAIGHLERQCLMCASTIKITHRSNWGMKSHLKSRHPTEWFTEVEPFLKRKVRIKFQFRFTQKFRDKNHTKKYFYNNFLFRIFSVPIETKEKIFEKISNRHCRHWKLGIVSEM